MLKKYSILASIVISFAGLTQNSALAASAIAQDGENIVYRCVGANVDAARSCVLSYCAESGRQCSLLATHGYRGYTAVAQSLSRVAWAMGHSSPESAYQSAMGNCAKNLPTGDVCRITLTYVDNSPANSRPISPCINPATGLPMLSGQCWGVDIQGNPYGSRNP